jgi:hypothetical protein
MKKILEFEFEISGEKEVEIPFGSEIVKVDVISMCFLNNNKQISDKKTTTPLTVTLELKLWCICPAESTKVKRKFVIIQTGEEFENSDSFKYIDTVTLKHKLTCHLFEKL